MLESLVFTIASTKSSVLNLNSEDSCQIVMTPRMSRHYARECELVMARGSVWARQWPGWSSGLMFRPWPSPTPSQPHAGGGDTTLIQFLMSEAMYRHDIIIMEGTWIDHECIKLS